MHLTPHSLHQIDDAYLQSWEVEALRGLSMRLLADLQEAWDRLNQGPDNSGRPPMPTPTRRRATATRNRPSGILKSRPWWRRQWPRRNQRRLPPPVKPANNPGRRGLAERKYSRRMKNSAITRWCAPAVADHWTERGR